MCFIGYGSVAPRTAWGKLVTILYALIGIPLMLIYLSTTGDVLARSFRRLYGKLCGTTPVKASGELAPSTTNFKTFNTANESICLRFNLSDMLDNVYKPTKIQFRYAWN